MTEGGDRNIVCTDMMTHWASLAVWMSNSTLHGDVVVMWPGELLGWYYGSSSAIFVVTVFLYLLLLYKSTYLNISTGVFAVIFPISYFLSFFFDSFSLSFFFFCCSSSFVYVCAGEVLLTWALCSMVGCSYSFCSLCCGHVTRRVVGCLSQFAISSVHFVHISISCEVPSPLSHTKFLRLHYGSL